MPSLPPSGLVVSVGVDWLTATYQPGPVAREAMGLAGERIYWQTQLGNDETRSGREGYRTVGSRGIACGRREYDGSVAVWLSGEVAREHWETFARLADNVTRLDIQATVSLPEPDTRVAKNAARQLRRFVSPAGGRPRKPKWVREWKLNEDELIQGTTLYMGSRRSDLFGRLYDKGVESKTAEPGRLWRYELEAKREPAFNLIRELLAVANNEHGDGPGTNIRRRVHTEFRKRGIRPRFEAEGVIPIETKREESDLDGRKAYLRTCVAPMLSKMFAAGVTPEEMTALLSGWDAAPDPGRLAGTNLDHFYRIKRLRGRAWTIETIKQKAG